MRPIRLRDLAPHYHYALHANWPLTEGVEYFANQPGLFRRILRRQWRFNGPGMTRYGVLFFQDAILIRRYTRSVTLIPRTEIVSISKIPTDHNTWEVQIVTIGGNFCLEASLYPGLSWDHFRKWSPDRSLEQPALSLDLRCVPAEERHSLTHFDIRRASIERVNPVSVYTCPHCAAEVRFEYKDFAKHFVHRYSNLAVHIATQFTLFKGLEDPYIESFLDFSCPGCGSPVRVMYSGHEIAMGAYNYHLMKVIELANPDQCQSPGDS